MLSYLLDEHLSPKIATQITRKRPDIPIISVCSWQDGHFLGKSDELIISTATVERLTFVTYDQKSIMPVLSQWGYARIDHAGVIFIDNHTIASDDIGQLVRALIAYWDVSRNLDWTNVVRYLRPE